MASLVEDLIQNLEDQFQCYKQVLHIQDDKTKAIVDNHLDKVHQVTSLENELVGKISRLERQRITIISDIALVLNKKEEELTVLRLTELLKNSQEESHKLLELRSAIVEVINQLKDINQQNKMLMDHALHYVEFTINAIQTSRSIPDTSNYASKGKAIQKSQGTHYFDAKQ